MSIQSEINRIKSSVADVYAIAEKKGATMPALRTSANLAATVESIEASGGFAIPLIATVDAGATVTATCGVTTLTGVSDGTVTFILPKPGKWTVSAVMNNKEAKPVTITVDESITAELEFKAPSRLPDGYTEVEYIQSDGNQAIMAIGPSGSMIMKTKVIMDVETLEGKYGSFFGCQYNDSDYRRNVFYAFVQSDGIKAGFCKGSGLLYKTIDSDATPRRVTICLDAPGNLASVDDKSIVPNEDQSILDSNMPYLALFCYKNKSGSQSRLAAKLYSCQIFCDGSLYRDLIPCTNPSGIAGLYDLVDETFYTCSSTPNFVAGPAI